MVITQQFRMFLAGSCSPEMIDYKSFTVSKQSKEKGMNSDMLSHKIVKFQIENV